jgi:hypothetical protein
VHRPRLPEQKLVDIFQEQREAKVSGQLTLNYKRVLYVLENCAENSCIARKTVQVYEDEDGQVTIRFQGRSLKFRAFPKEGPTGVTQGDIVANKHLVGALTRIHEQPQRREAERVEKLTTPARAPARARRSRLTTADRTSLSCREPDISASH